MTATLSIAASAVARLIDSAFESADLDAGFDGGEFSGPANARSLQIRIRETLATLGWTVEEFDRVLRDRVSDRWIFHSSPFDVIEVDRTEEEREAYASLADEMNDGDPWDPEDWQPEIVRLAAVYAQREGLSWPPGLGDFDRFYEKNRRTVAARTATCLDCGARIAANSCPLCGSTSVVDLDDIDYLDCPSSLIPTPKENHR